MRIEPCAEAASKQPCKIKRGRTANISFDYTSGTNSKQTTNNLIRYYYKLNYLIAGFNSDNLVGQVYWVSGEGDLPFVGMNTAACQHTACPLEAPTRQTYTYNFQTAKKFPAVSVARTRNRST